MNIKKSSASRAPLCVFLLVSLLAYMSISFSHYVQYANNWKANPESYYLNDVPMMSTLDAYKWVRIADEYRKGTYGQTDTDKFMYYPDGKHIEKPTPLLSVILAKLSVLFDGNLYETGLFLIPILAGLFIFPFAAYFYRVGYPSAGIVGGVLGCFSTIYYMRTTPGRVDTDALNLFFPFLIAFFIKLASETDKKNRIFFFSALAGASQLLFYWWYQHAAFILIFLITLVFSLLISRKCKISTIIVAAALFILCANPIYFSLSIDSVTELLTKYFFKTVALADGYPNVYQTVSEVGKLTPMEIFNTFIHPIVFFLALAGFALMSFANFKKMVPILPVFAVGMLAFLGSMRFVMFLIPFLGAGIGYLVNVSTLRAPVKSQTIRDMLGYLCAVLVVIAVMKAPTNSGFVLYAKPNVSIAPPIYQTFNMMRDKLPPDSAVYTWWDYGLAIEAQAGLATFHDGMSQNTLKTWLIARSLLNDQQSTANNIKYIANNGVSDILNKVQSGVSALDVVNEIDKYSEPLEKDNIYLSFTFDMVSKFPAINYIGGWNVASGKPGYATRGIAVMNCTSSDQTYALCNNIPVDLVVGMLNKTVPLKRIVSINAHTGTVASVKESGLYSTLSLLALQDGQNTLMVLIVPDDIYDSAFVQLYLLGLYDRNRYEEVISMYPWGRVYKVRK